MLGSSRHGRVPHRALPLPQRAVPQQRGLVPLRVRRRLHAVRGRPALQGPGRVPRGNTQHAHRRNPITTALTSQALFLPPFWSLFELVLILFCPQQTGVCPPPGKCQNLMGSFQCTCPPGYQLDPRTHVCVGRWPALWALYAGHTSHQLSRSRGHWRQLAATSAGRATD